MRPDPSHTPKHGSRAPSSPTRRQVLRATGSLAAAGMAASFLTSAAKVRPTKSASGPVTWDLRAVVSSYTFGDGETIPFFRYEPVGGGDTRGTLPYAEATEGDSLTVVVENQLPVPFRPVIRGVAKGPLVRPGATRSFSITTPPAGTYLLSSSSFEINIPGGGGGGSVRAADLALRPSNRTTGLAGTLVSRPIGGGNVLYAGGPTYDREYVHLWDDADDRWNRPTPNPIPSLTDYEPNYFTVNGLAAPTSLTDVDCRIVGNVGERILLRQLNAGRLRHAIHFHGYHVEIATRDNVPVTNMPEKDTWPLPARSTMDLILTPDKAGVFPMHPHHVYAVTANGLYPFGQLVHQDIS